MTAQIVSLQQATPLHLLPQAQLLETVRTFGQTYAHHLDLTDRRDRVLLYLTNTRSKIFQMKKKPNHSQPNWGYWFDGKLYHVYGWGTVYDNISSTQPKALKRYVFTVVKMLLPVDAIELVLALGVLHGKHNASRMGWNPRSNCSNLQDYDVPVQLEITPPIVDKTNESKLVDKILVNIKAKKEQEAKKLGPMEDDPLYITPRDNAGIFEAVKSWIYRHFLDHPAADDMVMHLRDVHLSNDYDTCYDTAAAAIDYFIDDWIDNGGFKEMYGTDFIDEDIGEWFDETEEEMTPADWEKLLT